MNVQKAFAITDAKISFVSLVNKAANKKQFLITKAKNGQADFSTYGKIVKTDKDSHFVTGIVYEPMAEDAHGNYMTADEIKRLPIGMLKTEIRLIYSILLRNAKVLRLLKAGLQSLTVLSATTKSRKALG